MYANYHTHTYRCKHATGDDREYVEAAIDANIKVLGFSDHCPWVYPNEFESRIRMSPWELEDYVESLMALRDEYKDDIQILIGLEEEYIPELLYEQDKLLAQYPIDYLIMGQHFLGQEDQSIYMGSVIESPQYLQDYVDSVIAGLRTERYLYLAHPDLIRFVGNPTLYRRAMRRLCEFLKENGYPIEINMLGAVKKRNYPDPRFLEIAKDVGNQVIIGIDAHSPEQLNNPEGESLCRQLAYGMEIIEELPIGGVNERGSDE